MSEMTQTATVSEYALRIAGPETGRLEVSIDGAPYRPCRYADGYWWHYWSGNLQESHHMVVVIRSEPKRG